MRALFVNADPSVAHAISLMLKASGIVTDHTCAGPEALKLLQRRSYDVILLDLNMPMFTGWDFLERMQSISQYVKKNIKVFVLTSSVRIEDTENAEQYPFVRSVISKPLNPNTIEKITQRHYVE